MVGQNVCGKGIVQKKWIKLLISGRNGGSNFLHPPIGGRHRLLYFRTNIKATNMKEIQQGNLLQLSKSSRSKNGGAYFSAVCGSNLVPVSATEAHWHRVCDRLLGFFSRAHFFCFPEVCRAQSCSACRLTLWKYGWKDEKYL